MSVNLSPVGGAGAQFCDNNGNPLNGGKLYTYGAGTTTPAATYTSAAGSVFHTNPIVLNAGGRVPDSGEIWLSDNISYKFVLKTSADVLIATWDNINGINSNFVNYTIQEEVITATAGQTVFNLSTITYAPGTNSLAVYIDGVNQIVTDSYIETDANTVTFVSGLHDGALVKFTTAVPATGTATTADLVTYNPPFTGAVAETVAAKLAQTVSVKDFGAVGDGVTDDTAAIQAALNSLPLTGGAVYFPNGSYLVSSQLSVNVAVSFVGDGASITGGGQGATQILKDASMTEAVIKLIYNGSSVENMDIRGVTGNTGDGLQISCSRAQLLNVGVYLMGQDGIRVGEDTGLINCNCFYFQNIKAKSNTRYGLHLSSNVAPTLPDVNAGTISSADIQSNGSHGFYLNNARIGTYSGIAAQNNGGDGVHLTSVAHNQTFIGGDTEGNTGYNIYIASGAIDNVILNLVNGTGGSAKISDSGDGTIWANDDGLKAFSPAVAGSTTAGTCSYTNRQCTYVRRAGRVDMIIQLVWTGHTGTGNLLVTGLPYTSHASYGRTMIPIGANNLTYGAGTVTGYIENSDTKIQVFLQATGAALSAVPIDAAGSLFIQMSYVPA